MNRENIKETDEGKIKEKTHEIRMKEMKRRREKYKYLRQKDLENQIREKIKEMSNATGKKETDEAEKGKTKKETGMNEGDEN